MKSLTRTQREWGIGLSWVVTLALCAVLARTGHLSGTVLALAFFVAIFLPAWWWNHQRG